MTGKTRDGAVHLVSRPVVEFREDTDHHIPGDHAGGATPVPIPNTEVKPSRGFLINRYESIQSTISFVKRKWKEKVYAHPCEVDEERHTQTDRLESYL